MVVQLVVVAGILALVVAAVALVYVLGMRRKSRFVQAPLIRLQRAVINPRQMRSAGTPGAYAAVIRHRGRISGQAYETPVGAVATDDGFVIALVYGARTNWLRNVLAAGSATLVHEGQASTVDRPEIVPMSAVQGHFALGDQRGFRWLGVDQALRVRRVEPGRDAERSAHAVPGDPAAGAARVAPGPSGA